MRCRSKVLAKGFGLFLLWDSAHDRQGSAHTISKLASAKIQGLVSENATQNFVQSPVSDHLASLLKVEDDNFVEVRLAASVYYVMLDMSSTEADTLPPGHHANFRQDPHG